MVPITVKMKQLYMNERVNYAYFCYQKQKNVGSRNQTCYMRPLQLKLMCQHLFRFRLNTLLVILQSIFLFLNFNICNLLTQKITLEIFKETLLKIIMLFYFDSYCKFGLSPLDYTIFIFFYFF